MKTKDITEIALFTAITISFGLFPPIIIPIIGIPITLQSLGPMLAGSIIGAKKGCLAILLFILLIAVGFPVLSGGRGGIVIFMGPTAGCIFMWPLSAFIIGYMLTRIKFKIQSSKILYYISIFSIIAFGGIVIVYLGGILWLCWLTKMTVAKASLGFMLFLPGDILKAAVSTKIFVVIKKYNLVA